MILFIGDKPSKRTDPTQAFKGAACEPRLKSWINQVTDGKPYAIYNRLDIAWDRFNSDSYKVVALGYNASATLKAYGVEHFRLPHPSGRNRLLNNKDFIGIKLLECKEFING